jgi:hypothetical protein
VPFTYLVEPVGAKLPAGRAGCPRLCYTYCMKTPALQTLLDRVHTWPKGVQDEVVKALREIEEGFIIGPATRHELDRSHQEALRGEGVDMEEPFGRYKL